MSNPQGIELDQATRDRLIAMRHKRGLTQSALARKCNVDRVTIANAEIGRKSPSHDLLERWGVVLGKTITVITKVTIK